MLFFLAQGLDAAWPIETRLLYITNHQVLWTVCWIAWIFAAVSLIYFLVNWGILLEHLATESMRPKIVFGVLISALGMIPDTIAETLYIGLIPQLANNAKVNLAGSPSGAFHEFAMWQQCINLITGFLGNGFYCVGGLTLALISLKTKPFPKKWALASFPIWLVGFGLSVAALLDHNAMLKFTTAFTMVAFVVWAACLGIFFRIDQK